MKVKDVQRFCERVVLAFANMVLHHAEDSGHMLREMAWVVKPGGVIAIVDEVKYPFAWMREEHRIGHMRDILEHASLVLCFLVHACRGLEPRFGECGHIGDVGSQLCNRLPHYM